MRKILSFLMVTLFSASMFAATWTVAGDNTAVFGKAWDPSVEANEMTLVDGLYTFVKADVTLPETTILFKVVKGHAWGEEYPASNYQLPISTSGKYDITITFNESTKEVVGKAEKKEDVVVLPSIAMHGNFTGSWTDTENFAVAEGNQTASLKLTLEAKNFEFGMRIGGPGNWTSNGSAFTRANNSHVINAGSGNLTLKADAAGEYTFTWTFATNTLEITFPESVGPIEPDPNFYITGDEALLGDKAWNPAAIAVMADSYTFENLAAGAYKLKVTLDGTWNDGKVKGFDDLTEKAEGLTADGDGNICFTLFEAGNVVVTYTNTVFTLEGKFTEGTPVEKYCEKASGHLKDPEFADVNGRILLTIAAIEESNNVLVKVKNNTAAGNTHNGLNYLWVNAANAKEVVRYGDGTHAEADVEEVSVVVEFDAPQTSFNFINIHWAYSGWEGEWAIDGLEVSADELCPSGDQPQEPKFYITGDEALLGDKAWNPAAIAVMADSYTFENLAAGDYKLKVTLDGTWNDGKVKGFADLTEKAEGLTADGDGNICFSLAEAGNVVVTYTATVFTVEGNFTPAEVLADGFYLVGTISNWAAVEANVFVANPESEGEYQLSITLAENDEFKAVYVENGAIKDWYPAEGGNYVVDADHAGECTVYFRPDGQGGADWFGGHLFVAKNGETAILNTMDAEKVVKMIENGQLIIIKNGVRYNAQGAVVR